jgi:signal transduction histidine kinase
VTVRVTERDQYWYIHVHNKGTIPEHIRPNFFQKYTSAGKKRGTGLGAYTVKLVADTLGGKADFTTSREEGTTITVSLPKL